MIKYQSTIGEQYGEDISIMIRPSQRTDYGLSIF